MNNKMKAFIVACMLLVISIVVSAIYGNTYTVEIPYRSADSRVEEIDVQIQDKNIAECVDISLVDETLKIKMKSIARGKTHVDVFQNDEPIRLFSLYVHAFGIITYNEYFGDSTGSIIFPISIIVFLLYVLYLLVISFRKKCKQNMYSYKNIAYLGIIIFVAVTIISQLHTLSNYRGITETINGILSLFSFTFILLPVAFVVSILIIISNISLIRKEGFSFTNLLGILLGGLLCFFSILPEIMYQMLYAANWIDIHNQNGVGLYLYNFVETAIYVVLAYIECVLMGTIIMGIKAARHLPKFDKDGIIILGCQIRKDGTLTKLLKARVDRAIEFANLQEEATGKDILFVPSGGKGNDEVISEAQAMKNYLLAQGIPEEQILMEDQSKNTYENIQFSNRIIHNAIKDPKIAFATTNYHVFRAGAIASSQNIAMEGIGAKTKTYFWVNAFIREFIATLFSEKKKHIIIICGMILAAIGMIGVQYLSNTL